MHCLLNVNQSQKQKVFLSFSQPQNVLSQITMTDFLPFHYMQLMKSLPLEPPPPPHIQRGLTEHSVLALIFLTIIPRARTDSESIAHETEGRMGY